MVAEDTRFRSNRRRENSSGPTEWVEENPFTSVAVLFGIGVGIGFLLGHTIAEVAGRRLLHEDSLSEKLTCRIREALKSTLPEGIFRHLA